jgi:hypothetical protein
VWSERGPSLQPAPAGWSKNDVCDAIYEEVRRPARELRGLLVARVNAFVIPQSTDTTVASVARMSDQLDLFITGNNGRVYTSWWHEGRDWSRITYNWRPIGGFFPVGI